MWSEICVSALDAKADPDATNNDSETPLHKGHLELMVKAADLGAVILPPVPAFYHRPKTIMDIVHQTVGRALDQFGIEHDLFERWKGV